MMSVHESIDVTAPDRTEVADEERAADEERVLARQRLESRRDFASHVVAFVTVNAFLVAVWWITGTGYFWPAWVLAGWGIGLVLHAWEAFLQHPVTEADVDRELARRRR